MLILKGLIGGLIQIALFGAFLVVPAGLVPGGTWYWTRALMFIGVYGFILEATIVALAVVAPANQVATSAIFRSSLPKSPTHTYAKR